MMNIKVIAVTLIIGVLIWQIDAARSKSSRKKTTDRSDTSGFSSSASGETFFLIFYFAKSIVIDL